MRLADGTFFPIPLTLPVPAESAVGPGQRVMLRDSRNEPVAVLAVEEVFERDPDEARIVAGTEDTRHPLVAEMARWPSRYASGTLRVLGLRHATTSTTAPHAARGAPPAGRARARAWSRSRRGTPSTARTSG